MIERIKYIESKEYDPHFNLALEEYLLRHVKPGEAILYLWQNEKTVVIGKNQNPWKECRIKELEADGGKMVRRLSGGGAVFHDLGNLNFTFLINKEDYDLDKQLEVIIKAVNSFSIPAEKSGRNDITVHGRKFSGNAFYTDGNHSYHHGTILVNVEMENLSKYLNVSRDKLVSKGVDSVKSRVVNLTEFNKDLTIDLMKIALIKSFSQVYGKEAVSYEIPEGNIDEITELKDKYISWEWKFGRKIEFSDSYEKRFPWGNIELLFRVEGGVIKECMAYSDAMDICYINQISDSLLGCRFTQETIGNELGKIPADDPVSESIKESITNWLTEEI